MIKCIGSNVFICIKCSRYEPKANKRLYQMLRELIDHTDCRFFKLKKGINLIN